MPLTPPSEKHHAYWRANLRITALLLLVWFVVTFVVPYCARELSFEFFGWPFSVWMGGQGALIGYLALVGYYARHMRRLDAEHRVHEDD